MSPRRKRAILRSLKPLWGEVMRVGDAWGLSPGAARRWGAAWFAIVAAALIAQRFVQGWQDVDQFFGAGHLLAKVENARSLGHDGPELFGVSGIPTLVFVARRDSAEHFFRSSALHCTATARILIPAECSAVS